MTLPRGYFENVLAIDCDTTGLCFTSESPVYNSYTKERHQTVSWGLIVANATTFEPVEELYLEIKWNDSSILQRQQNPSFGKEAENVHGLTKTYLDEHGISEEQAAAEIGNLIVKHWGVDSCVRTLGHNVATFDLLFLRDLLTRQQLNFKFGNRHYDSSSLSLGTVGAFNSDDLFTTLGFDARNAHNSLEDARMSLNAFRIISTLWKGKVGIRSYE